MTTTEGPEETHAASPAHGHVPWGTVLRNVALVTVVLVMIWLAFNVRLPSIAGIRADVEAAGAWGPIVFVLLYAAVATTPIPVTIMAVAGGMIFGVPLGTLLSLIGVVTGCLGGYGIARLLGERTVMRLLGSHAAVVEDRLAGGGFYAVCTLRLMPGIPYWPVNYGSGALGVTARDFLVATLLASLPGQLSLVAVGAFMGSPDVPHGVVLGCSWALVIVLTVLAFRRWRGTRAQAPAEGDASQDPGIAVGEA